MYTFFWKKHELICCYIYIHTYSECYLSFNLFHVNFIMFCVVPFHYIVRKFKKKNYPNFFFSLELFRTRKGYIYLIVKTMIIKNHAVHMTLWTRGLRDDQYTVTVVLQKYILVLVTCDLCVPHRVEKKERARLKTVKFNSKSREKGVSAPQHTHIHTGMDDTFGSAIEIILNRTELKST